MWEEFSLVFFPERALSLPTPFLPFFPLPWLPQVYSRSRLDVQAETPSETQLGSPPSWTPPSNSRETTGEGGIGGEGQRCAEHSFSQWRRQPSVTAALIKYTSKPGDGAASGCQACIPAHSWGLEEKAHRWGSLKGREGGWSGRSWQGTLLNRQDERKGDTEGLSDWGKRRQAGPGVAQGNSGASREGKHLFSPNRKPPGFL